MAAEATGLNNMGIGVPQRGNLKRNCEPPRQRRAFRPQRFRGTRFEQRQGMRCATKRDSRSKRQCRGLPFRSLRSSSRIAAVSSDSRRSSCFRCRIAARRPDAKDQKTRNSPRGSFSGDGYRADKRGIEPEVYTFPFFGYAGVEPATT